MTVGNLSNCSKCGNLFIFNGTNICQQCLQKVEEEYKLCADYLREHNLVNIYALSSETGVSVRQITQFVREGRISVAESPNLGYPCDSCGTLINKGRLCDKCTNNFNQKVKKVTEGSKEERVLKQNTYYQFKDQLDK